MTVQWIFYPSANILSTAWQCQLSHSIVFDFGCAVVLKELPTNGLNFRLIQKWSTYLSYLVTVSKSVPIVGVVIGV